ncbi:lytic murein transglycosylase [Erythrobacteraceae bacterium CFH 75059]|uniref:lytic murein transglycosylase n=1 Tax=Qipengyuania thermophila TaxID=2509361 RepID=UPI0010219E61|nr:lytic murein transglycosylase [Qipengyuania thermophila]TCD05200.1 lytic murein transglycosylase [Erythrobacteraceae bacterium CFH 75059]
MTLRRTFLSLVAPLAAFCSVPAAAQTDLSFDGYLAQLNEQARRAGVSEATLVRMSAGMQPDSRVISLDRAQPGSPNAGGAFPPVSAYISRHVDAARIGGGRRVYAETRHLERTLEQHFGVPLPILVAIFGHETAYGQVLGNFDLARSLATLAWEGRRRDLFAAEYVALMRIADRNRYTREQLRGSWAGAFGNPQFLPSVYLRLAVDGDGDGRADLFSSRADTLASIANYLRDAGWRRNEPWGVGATVPTGFDWSRLGTRLNAPVCPRVHDRHSTWMTVAEWRALGVRPTGAIRDDVHAFLFQPDGAGTPAYLLTNNYRAILEYNCSNYYAMSVGLLADAVSG